MKNLISFITGLIFALGLGLSGMTNVDVVKGFLDIFGTWNYALMGVMLGAITVHSLFYFFIKKRTSPILDTKFYLPTRKDIDTRLVMGAAIFGIGWGWAGICPGPGLVSLMGGQNEILYFIFSMIIGMKTFHLVEKKS